jgi:hypothetical protein
VKAILNRRLLDKKREEVGFFPGMAVLQDVQGVGVTIGLKNSGGERWERQGKSEY